MAVQENIGAGSIDCKHRVGKATFMLLKSKPHSTILTSASVEELVAVTLAFTVLGMAGLTLLYNKIYKIKPKITPHYYVCDDKMHTVQWWIQGREPGGSVPPLLLDQTVARRAKKILGGGPPPYPYLRVWMTGPPPNLKVWIRHCCVNFNMDFHPFKTICTVCIGIIKTAVLTFLNKV